MLTDLGYFAIICGIIAGVALVAFWLLRVIDHHYRCAEQDREYAYEAMLQNDAYVMERFGKRKELEIQYQYNQRLVQGICDRQRNLANDVIKQINDAVLAQAKEMMGKHTQE